MLKNTLESCVHDWGDWSPGDSHFQTSTCKLCGNVRERETTCEGSGTISTDDFYPWWQYQTCVVCGARHNTGETDPPLFEWSTDLTYNNDPSWLQVPAADWNWLCTIANAHRLGNGENEYNFTHASKGPLSADVFNEMMDVVGGSSVQLGDKATVSRFIRLASEVNSL